MGRPLEELDLRLVDLSFPYRVIRDVSAAMTVFCRVHLIIILCDVHSKYFEQDGSAVSCIVADSSSPPEGLSTHSAQLVQTTV